MFTEFEEVMKTTLGTTHKSYLKTKYALATSFYLINDLEKAIQLYEDVAEARLNLFGPTDENYLIVKSSLSRCIVKQRESESTISINGNTTSTINDTYQQTKKT